MEICGGRGDLWRRVEICGDLSRYVWRDVCTVRDLGEDWAGESCGERECHGTMGDTGYHHCAHTISQISRINYLLIMQMLLLYWNFRCDLPRSNYNYRMRTCTTRDIFTRSAMLFSFKNKNLLGGTQFRFFKID